LIQPIEVARMQTDQTRALEESKGMEGSMEKSKFKSETKTKLQA
jgi:hypothetical protein